MLVTNADRVASIRSALDRLAQPVDSATLRHTWAAEAHGHLDELAKSLPADYLGPAGVEQFRDAVIALFTGWEASEPEQDADEVLVALARVLLSQYPEAPAPEEPTPPSDAAARAWLGVHGWDHISDIRRDLIFRGSCHPGPWFFTLMAEVWGEDADPGDYAAEVWVVAESWLTNDGANPIGIPDIRAGITWLVPPPEGQP